jgi:Family of unknown function (DUF5906)
MSNDASSPDSTERFVIGGVDGYPAFYFLSLSAEQQAALAEQRRKAEADELAKQQRHRETLAEAFEEFADDDEERPARELGPDRFRNAIIDVAKRIFGEPNRKLSKGDELRYNARGSLCVYVSGPRKGTWKNFETGDGGGCLDLVVYGKQARDRAGAAAWCEEYGYIPKSSARGHDDEDAPKEKKKKPARGDQHPALGRPATTYDYVNATGKLLFQVCRFENPKDFRQRRPAGEDSWFWDVQGVKLIPYRLPELIEDIKQGRTIFICEGEKDVDAARAKGVAATCNPGGAGKWRTEYNEYLLGANVVVVGDNDPQSKNPKTGELLFHPDGRPKLPGQDHMMDVAAKLANTAERIRLLDLGKMWPECPSKGDTYDYLQCHTPEQFNALADAAPDFEPADAGALSLDDFRAYLPMHQYVYMPTGELWPASSVDAKLAPVGKLKASTWLDQNRSVAQMTWAPGEPDIIEDKVVANGGWIERRGVAVFNLYKPPTLVHGDARKAGPWVKHVRRIYGRDALHIIRYLAHRVQRPHQKINHGLILGGAQGVGKDTMIEPVKRAVGPWNVQEISPQQILGRFNGFVKTVILRVSEARDLGDLNRFTFYEHTKIYLAAPPDVIRCDEKNLREHSVFNVMGVILTSNRKDSFYLPTDDRRHYVAWTDATQGDFTEEYWQDLWGWYDAGGDRHVAAYLAALDLAGFNPKAPPRKTDAFWEIVEMNRAPENSELDDILDELGRPDAVTLDMIKKTATMATGDFYGWISDRKNRRRVPHRLGECGYAPVRNPDADDGLWRVGGKRQAVYAKADLSVRDRIKAAEALTPPQSELPGV